MRKYRRLVFLLAAALVLSSCGSDPAPAGSVPSSADEPSQSQSSSSPAVSGEAADISQLFTARDYEVDYDESSCAFIRLEGDTASSSSNAVVIDGSTVTITDEGTYVLSGELDDGMIVVNADKEDKTRLVLDSVTIHSETSAPIYILQADKVFITLAADSVNSLSNGGSFAAVDDNNIDSVIFSKEDLTLNGSGTLTITSPGGHGIVSKDELTFTGGSYEISSASHGITGKDHVCIANAAFAITAGKDGIRAENDEDAALGFVHIESGVFNISAEGDGVSASASLCINDGTFDLVTGGGSANARQQTSDSWGDFMGGGMGGNHGGGPGGMGGASGGPGSHSGSGPTGAQSSVNSNAGDSTGDDSTSIKGIKAAGALAINGGVFVIDSADDAIHSNASLTVNGGTFTIATGDDGFHADEGLFINDCTVSVTQSYEGLEGLYVEITGGTIDLVAADDGINAAGGTDQSGFGGHRGGDMFAASDDSYISISGGAVTIQASGDGIDSNGDLTISGGTVTVCGPTNGDTAVLDFAGTGTITGGTFMGTGAYAMAQTFSDSEGQGVIAVSVGSQPAGTRITLTDSAGNTVISHEPELSFAIVILSSPDIVKGETYTITVGSASGEFAAC